MIADEHRGLRNAVRKMLREAQRCTVHLERNVLAKVPRRLRGRVAKQLRHVFAAESVDAVKQRVGALESGLGAQIPEAIACLRAAVPRDPVPGLPQGPLASHPLDQRPGAAPRRDQAPHPLRRRLPRSLSAPSASSPPSPSRPPTSGPLGANLDMTLLDQRKEVAACLPA